MSQPKRQSIDDLFPDEDLEVEPVPIKRKSKATVKEETTLEETPEETKAQDLEAELEAAEEAGAKAFEEPVKEEASAPTKEEAEKILELEDIIEEEEKQRKQSRPKKPFNVRDGLTYKQWDDVEQYYIDSVSQIVIPEEPSSSEILKLVSDIDRLFTEARFDQAYISRALKRHKGRQDNAKKTVYKQIKDIAKNDKERDAEGIAYLEATPLPGDAMSIFDLTDAYTDRDEFMDAVISTLKQKGDKLIIVASALKMELNLIR